MQLSVVAVFILTLEVVDAVSNVARLLYLSNEASCANGMNTTSRNEEAVVLFHLILCECIGDGVVLNHFLILLSSDLHFQTIIEFSVFVAWQRIPHFCLSTLFTLLASYFVVGVNLDREVAVGINKLDEQWELVAEALIVLLT